MVNNIYRTKNSVEMSEYDYFEFTAILSFMFIPLTNRGNIIRLIIISVFIFKRLFTNSFRLLINSRVLRILEIMVLGLVVPLIIIPLFDHSFNFSLWSHEAIRLMFYILLLLEVPHIRISFRYVFITAIVVLVFNTGIQIIQKVGLFNINNWLRLVYTDPSATTTHLVTTEYLGNGFRSGSIFINPNVYMVIPCIILCVILQNNVVKSSLLNYAFCILTLVSMLLTGSRTCIVVGAVIILMYLFSNKSISFQEKTIVLIISLAVLLFMLINTNITTSFRIFNISNGLERSLFFKFRNFIYYVNNTNPVYLLVGGIGSPASEIQIDAEWGYIIQYYGVFGIIWYIFLVVINPIAHSEKLSFFVKSSRTVIILIAFSATVVFCMPIYPYICLLSLSQVYVEKRRRPAMKSQA